MGNTFPPRRDKARATKENKTMFSYIWRLPEE